MGHITFLVLSILFQGWLQPILTKTVFEEYERDVYVRHSVEEDPDLFQGDITSVPSMFRNGLIDESRKWVNNTLPYSFIDVEGHRHTHYQRLFIRAAMKDMEKTLMVNGKKCITFKPRDKEPGYLYFVTREKSTTCSSPVGAPYWANYVNLGPGCMNKGIIQHELMHALGFYHEQSRSDRDDYVTINWQNMSPGARGQFKKYGPTKVTAYGEPYDYDSVLHYGPLAFSTNGKPTITPKKPGAKIGQREQLSIHDIRKIQKRYGCLVAPLNSTVPPPTVQPSTVPPPTVKPQTTVQTRCNFDEGDWCGLRIDGSPERWTITSGQDHTTGSGQFARFTVGRDEVKNFQRTSSLSIGRVESGKVYCVSFSTRVENDGEIELRAGNSRGWTAQPEKHGWKKEKVRLRAKVNDSLRMEVIMRSNTFGTVDVDDIEVKSGDC